MNLTKNAKFESVRKSIEHYLSTDWFMWVCFLIACFITVLRVEAIGLLIFAAIICAILVFCEDVIIALEPFLLLCLCLIKCNNSYDEFIKMVWLAVPAISFIISANCLTASCSGRCLQSPSQLPSAVSAR